jgi:hypothetical protein
MNTWLAQGCWATDAPDQIAAQHAAAMWRFHKPIDMEAPQEREASSQTSAVCGLGLLGEIEAPSRGLAR